VSLFDRFKIKPRDARDSRSRPSDRIDELSALVKERRGDWSVENELADALVQYGRLDEAVTRLCAIGDRLAADGFTAKAHAFYKKALRLRPNNEYATHRVAELSVERINQVALRLGSAVDDPGEDESIAPDTVNLEAPDSAATAAESASNFVFEPTAHQLPPVEATSSTESEPPVASDDASDFVAAPALSAETDAPKTVEQIVADAMLSATCGALDTAVTALMDCARGNPELIEPVARLAEIAATNGLDDVLADAEARLCDLHCRQGDYQAARTVAEALVMRYPGDTRHRARLACIEGELYEATSESPDDHEVILDEIVLTPDMAVDVEFQRALDVLLAWDADSIDEQPLADARAALIRAADVPRHRVAACRQLARLDAEAGRWVSALTWLENAAVGIESSADEEELAYQIALVLEHAGEHDRALGVLNEIATKAGPEYRDISERILRLSSSHGDGLMHEQLVAS
jgi:tetratricopeptide (TPR) repeat protein